MHECQMVHIDIVLFLLWFFDHHIKADGHAIIKIQAKS